MSKMAGNESLKLKVLRDLLQNELSLRNHLPDVTGDRKLSRFLKSQNNDVQKAADKISDYLRWRDIHRVDDLRDEILNGNLSSPKDFIEHPLALEGIRVLDQFGLPFRHIIRGNHEIDATDLEITYIVEYKSLILHQLSFDKQQDVFTIPLHLLPTSLGGGSSTASFPFNTSANGPFHSPQSSKKSVLSTISHAMQKAQNPVRVLRRTVSMTDKRVETKPVAEDALRPALKRANSANMSEPQPTISSMIADSSSDKQSPTSRTRRNTIANSTSPKHVKVQEERVSPLRLKSFFSLSAVISPKGPSKSVQFDHQPDHMIPPAELFEEHTVSDTSSNVSSVCSSPVTLPLPVLPQQNEKHHTVVHKTKPKSTTEETPEPRKRSNSIVSNPADNNVNDSDGEEAAAVPTGFDSIVELWTTWSSSFTTPTTTTSNSSSSSTTNSGELRPRKGESVKDFKARKDAQKAVGSQKAQNLEWSCF